MHSASQGASGNGQRKFVQLGGLALLVGFAIHIIAAVSISLENRNKRGERYQHRPDYHYVTYASRTMLWSGIIVAAFIHAPVAIVVGAIAQFFGHR